jgi:hypothetical protein
MTPLIGSDALLQCGIVEVAATPEDFLQRTLLGRCGTQLLFVSLAKGLAVHGDLFCLIGAKAVRDDHLLVRLTPEVKPSDLRRPNFCQGAGNGPNRK